ncbi:hypothetical protein ScPMuIL_013931 [Solemya velum]
MQHILITTIALQVTVRIRKSIFVSSYLAVRSKTGPEVELFLAHANFFTRVVCKMATSTEQLSFSDSGDYFLHSSPDGILKLWETDTGSLKQEYTPSSHLSATCTCLSWCSKKRPMKSPKKKKKRLSSIDGVPIDLVAIGTLNGNILLYSTVEGELRSQLVDGHSGPVNDICWQASGRTLFSCSNDAHIVEWDVKTGKSVDKWKADKRSVHSLCLLSEEKLLSAGRTIHLWDLHKKEIMMSFTGHATKVFRLLKIPSDGESNYFLSAASDDRLINLWHTTAPLGSKMKTAIASFSLGEEPVLIHLSPSSKKGELLLLVVTKSGQVLMFEHTMNGKLLTQPLKPIVKIKAATACQRDGMPTPIKILAAHCTGDRERNLLMAYGNFLKPKFEKIPFDKSKPEVCLVRDDPMSNVIRTESDISRVKTPSISKDMTLLTPGQIAPSGPLQQGQRRKRKPSTTELSMAERLNAMSVDMPTATAPPTADSVAVLLTQGLQSQDKKILNNVLQNRDEMVIRKTVRQLPVQAIIPLVHELSLRMQGHAQSGQNIVKWIKTVLTVHTSYLMTFPKIVDTLSSLYQMMESRVSMFGKLSRLQGKLGLVLSQITSQGEEEEDPIANQQPLLLYQAESSDESIMEDFVQSPSEYSEGEWEDLSEMEVDVGEGEDDGGGEITDDGGGDGTEDDDGGEPTDDSD